MVLNTTLFKNTYEEEDGILTNTLSGRYENNRVVTLGSFALYNQQHITELILSNAKNINQYACANLSNCSHIELNWSEITTINQYAFRSCSLWKDNISCGATTIGSYAFLGCIGITGANFPDCTTVNVQGFNGCSNLTYVNIPSATTVGVSAFLNCAKLVSVNMSTLGTIQSEAFRGCSNLQDVDMSNLKVVGSRAFGYCGSTLALRFPKAYRFYQYAMERNYYMSWVYISWSSTAAQMDQYAFYFCSRLASLYLLGPNVMTLGNVNALANTPISTLTSYLGHNGSIYVPSSLYASYIASTNWVTYSARFVSMTDQEIEDFLSSL